MAQMPLWVRTHSALATAVCTCGSKAGGNRQQPPQSAFPDANKAWLSQILCSHERAQERTAPPAECGVEHCEAALAAPLEQICLPSRCQAC
jgi:hypothetical protein